MSIVNLNQFKKAKTKATKNKNAENNRVKYGRSKVVKNLEKSRKSLSDKKLDGHKIED